MDYSSQKPDGKLWKQDREDNFVVNIVYLSTVFSQVERYTLALR